MTSRTWRWLLALTLTLTGCAALDGDGEEELNGPNGPSGTQCTTELRPHFDGEGCCGEPVAQPLCSTGTIVFCEVRDSRFEPIGCYYTYNGSTKLRCASCRNTNDCVAAAVRVCGP